MNEETLAIRDIINNVKEIYMSETSLNILLDFERVLDTLNIYAYKNWKLGELIYGPLVEKYFVTCRFMWPKTKMPDPAGAKRLTLYGCKVNFQKTTINFPVKIKDPNDYEPGTKVPRMAKTNIWIVEIKMPRELMSGISKAQRELTDDSVDISELEDAYAQGLDDISTNDSSEVF